MSRQGKIQQFTFQGGELDPELYSRTDLARYQQSLRRCQNFIVRGTGAVRNRPGTKFVKQTKSSGKVRLIPFIAAEGSAYCLEFGNMYMRVHTGGGTVEWPNGTHSAVASSTTVLTDDTQNWPVNLFVGAVITKVGPGETATITANTADTITHSALSGAEQWDTDDEYSIAFPLHIDTPWGTTKATVLDALRFAQIGDVLVITHPEYLPRVLIRKANDIWELTAYPTSNDVQPPTTVIRVTLGKVTSGTAADVEDWTWVVTSVDSQGRESIASAPPFNEPAVVLSPNGIKQKISWTAPVKGPEVVRYNVYRGRGGSGVYGYVGTTEETAFTDPHTVPDYTDSPPKHRDPFEATAEARTHPTRLDGSGSAMMRYDTPRQETLIKNAANILPSGDDPAVAGYLDEYAVYWRATVKGYATHIFAEFVVSSKTAAGAWVPHKTIRVYATNAVNTQEVSGVVRFEHLGLVDLAEFKLDVTADNMQSILDRFTIYFDKVTWRTLDAGGEISQRNPTAVCFYQQRAMFGGMLPDAPQDIIASGSGNIYNFDRRTPFADDDALEFTIASTTLDAVRHLVPMEAVLILTASSELTLRGPEGEVITAGSIDVKKFSGHGASHAVPVVVGRAVIYIDSRERIARELAYTSSFGYGSTTERDLSVMARHLSKRYSIKEIAYQEVPDSVVWMRRSDGALLGLTYIPEHDVWGWHLHTTRAGDEIISVCAIPESERSDTNGGYVPGEPAMHAVYVAVKRSINGSTEYHVERMSNRDVVEAKQGNYLDDAVSYDGRNTNGLSEIEAEGGSTWKAEESMTLQAYGGSPFLAGDVGKEYELSVDETVAGTGDDPDVTTTYTCRFRVTAFTDANTITAYPITAVPTQLQGDGAGAKKTSEWGLAARSFAGLDHLKGETVGVVVDGAAHSDKLVDGTGTISLDGVDNFGLVVHVGLRYDMELQTLPIDLQGDAAVAVARKKVSNLYLSVDDYVGVKAGMSRTSLRPVDSRSVSDSWNEVQPGNSLVEIAPNSDWEERSSVVIKQTEPLPVAIASMVARIEVSDED